MNDSAKTPMGASGRIAAAFQSNALTPLLALVAALLGIFAMLVTPREEEPQIDVTMANVMIAVPGVSARDIEQLVAVPAEQVLSQMVGLEHVMSQSQPGLAVVTVQFEVGVDRETALIRLYDVVNANADWLPPSLGAMPPIVKARGIDSVPILAVTLSAEDVLSGAFELSQVAHLLENELKRVPGTKEVSTIGAPKRIVEVQFDPSRLSAANLSVSDLRYALQASNRALPAGELVESNRTLLIETGPLLDSAESVGNIVVGVHQGLPVFLSQVANVVETPATPDQYVWHWQRGDVTEQPAVTLQVSKKAGANAVTVSEAVLERINALQGVLIPDNIGLHISRNYGATADDKASKLIQKLIFATLSVVALVFFALGRREAAIVGVAVMLTLTATLFASWAWGFTLNRVSLFALIFSIGILVDDAIVVVENIHRHRALRPGAPLKDIIPAAVDEVGGPTILATLTVIAALLPMAFVSGLMGPYMAPIPINASLGMLLSLAIAFTVTPWLSRVWMAKHAHAENHGGSMFTKPIRRVFKPLLLAQKSSRNRRLFFAGVFVLIGLSMSLPVLQMVIMKMLPFDNKSEFQLMVNMPDDTSLERTAMVLHALGDTLQTIPEVTDYQAYVGTSAPMTFNGLVRQYDARRGGAVGDIQVNLLPKADRHEKSHAIAQRVLPMLEAVAKEHGAQLSLVEVPPGPPVQAPIVAEVYAPDQESLLLATQQVRAAFEETDSIVAIDDSRVTAAPRWLINVDQTKAALLGVSQAEIVATVQAALKGEDVTAIYDGVSKYAAPVRLILPLDQRADLNDLLRMTMTTAAGRQVPLSELVQVRESEREQVRFRKDGLPVAYVTGDKAGSNDSPLYGLFAIRDNLPKTESGELALTEEFIQQPDDAWVRPGIKWDGEWQITYETFRDMGAAYAVGLLLIYLLVVAEFRSYLTPLIIMAPIPLTIIGVMPGHALLGAQFTATSMIGMIALAGIIVRNSILLVDFIEQQTAAGVVFREAIISAAETRAQPIILTALAAMIGSTFILDDPIFNGLAISMIFGVFVSTLLTLVVIPLLYYRAYRTRYPEPN
jgi:multidrug efflux pump subunit AcrB